VTASPEQILELGTRAAGSAGPHVLVNAGGAISGGAQTHLVAVAEELGRNGDRGLRWEALIPADLAQTVEAASAGAMATRAQPINSPVRRIAWEQVSLPRVWRRSGADVLLSVANFTPLALSRGQVLVAGNALYFADVRVRGWRGARIAAEGILGRASARRAAVTVTPSESMADLVRERTGRPVVPVVFGPGRAERCEPGAGGVFTFVHRTHWGPHKRLIDLLEAVRILARTDAGAFRVSSACDPRTDFARSFAESRAERALLDDAAIVAHMSFEAFPVERQGIVEGDAVVMPSTTESFSFPLAEAIGLGLPVVAADTPFAREMCGDAAFYVAPHDPADLAAGMGRLLRGERPPSPATAATSRLAWQAHVDGLAAVCRWAAGASD
jgi:glycosyltransferase involved in cell wall biosynthesis